MYIMKWFDNFDHPIVFRYQFLLKIGHQLVPFFIIVTIHVKILIIAHHHRCQIAAQVNSIPGIGLSEHLQQSALENIDPNNDQVANKNMAHSTQTKGLLVVTLLLITLLVCWLPKCIFEIVTLLHGGVFETTTEGAVVIEIVSLLHMIKSFINPFVYACRIPEIRRSLPKTTCCQK